MSGASRVVFVLPWARRSGGAENILWTYLRHVDRTRIDPLVVFLEAGPFAGEVAALGIDTAVIPAGRLRHPGRALSAVRDLARLLRREQPTLVVDWSPKTHLYGAAAAAFAGMPTRIAWWQQGVPAWHWLDQLATLLPARGIGVYSQAAARAQQRYRPRRRVLVVPPGIESPGDVTPAPVEIPPERTVVGVVGRVEPGKRHDVFLETIALLPDAHGLIVGGAAFDKAGGEAELHALAERLGIAGRVTFTGQVADAKPYICRMDVLASASESESFGITLVEAMALGVPVVAFDAGGPAEIVEDGVSGVLVREPGAAALAAALEPLLADPPRRARLADAGRERFASYLRADRAAERMTAALEALAANAY